jgi:hypothetical protein
VDAALREHPQVYLPPQKQTYFFDENYERGFDWYLGEFQGATAQHRAVGEVATGYCLPHAAARLARHLPHVQVIMTMRHPVERAHSNFQVRRAQQGWTSFEDALAKEPDLIERGHYIEQVEALLENYPRQRLLLLLYEDLRADDRAYLRSILEFLGLSGDFESSQFGLQRNAAMFPRLRRSLHRVGLKPVVNALSRGPVGDAVRRFNRRRGRDSARGMDPATRARLVEHFRPYNAALAALLGRDLGHWDR